MLEAFGVIVGIGVSENLGRCTQTSLRFRNSLLTAHRSSLIAHRVPLKILYKTAFSYNSSWKVENAQLENFYFPVGKLFFLSWKIKISQ